MNELLEQDQLHRDSWSSRLNCSSRSVVYIDVRRLCIAMAIGVLVAACASGSDRPEGASVEQASPHAPSLEAAAEAGPSTPEEQRRGEHLLEIDPRTLETMGDPIGPLGGHPSHVARHGDLVAIGTYTGLGTRTDGGVVLIDLRSGDLVDVAVREFEVVGLEFDDRGRLVWVGHRPPGPDPNFPSGFRVHRYDPATGATTTLIDHDMRTFNVGSVGFLDDRVGIYGVTVSSEAFGLPHVLVADLDAGEVTVAAVLDTQPPVRDDSAWHSEARPAWDVTRGRIYVPHVSTDVVTTVDLDSGEATTQPIGTRTSWLDRLAASWLPAAHAKGVFAYRVATLHPEGHVLYLTGARLDGEDEVPTGVVALDSESMSEVARTDLAITELRVSPSGRQLLAGGSWETTDSGGGIALHSVGVYLLDALDLTEILHVGQDYPIRFVFAPDGCCALLPKSRRGEPVVEATIIVIDVESHDVNEMRVGRATLDPTLLRHGLIQVP